MKRFLYTVKLAWRSLTLHKLRSGLTILGIVFGVASVITMIAVGEGTAQSAQKSIRKLGTQNIIVTSILKDNKVKADNEIAEYGVTKIDVERIKSSMPEVKTISLQRKYEDTVRCQANSEQVSVIATDAPYFKVKKIDVIKGRKLCELDGETIKSVCVVSKSLAKKLFLYHDPLSQKLVFKGIYFDVVGITDELEPVVYIPIRTALKRLGDIVISQTSSSYSSERVDYHQIILHMERRENVIPAHSKLVQLMKYGHEEQDYQIKVPLNLLREAEKTKRMFNMVLGSIAGISLLVGGIGIMNIMLASVSERTKEIGLRRALGAKERDIVVQFLTESILLSLVGGIAGVMLGIFLPYMISNMFAIETVLTTTSVVLSFTISGLIGVVFGSYPAIKSAKLSPIVALRD